MLNITFNVDDDIMAKSMISKSIMPKEFAHYLWDKYKTSYSLLINNINSNEINKDIIYELQQQSFFKHNREIAKENLKRIKSNWNKNCNRINSFLNKILKKEIHLDLTAFIVPPSLNMGRNIGENQFIWGHENGLVDENYDLVYLVHESLHSYFKNNELTHTIIENIADVELAQYLNNTHYEVHQSLKSMHIKILPFWNIYLNKNEEDIVRENKINNISYNLEDFAEYKSKLENLNIDDFISFLNKLNLDDLINVNCSYSIHLKNM